MRLHPVVDVAAVVDAVEESLDCAVTLHSELDVDVYRLRRTAAAAAPDLVVRAFGAAVEREAVDAAAGVLHRLAGTQFPAERCANADPVLPIGDGRHLLITEYVAGSPASPGFVLAWCAALLGRLATQPAQHLPAGGGWHRLGPTPSTETDAALALGGQLGPSVAEAVETLADADDGGGLPEALIHADLTPPMQSRRVTSSR